MIRIPRNDAAGEIHTLKIEGDRSGLEELFTDGVLPMFIYSDDGEDWVRLAIPPGLLPGIADMECPCCGEMALPAPQGGVMLDVRFDDVNWHIRELVI